MSTQPDRIPVRRATAASQSRPGPPPHARAGNDPRLSKGGVCVHENIVVCGPSGTARATSSKLSATPPSTGAPTSPGSPSKRSAPSSDATSPTTPTGRALKRVMRADVMVIDDIGLLHVAAETASTESSTPPTRNAPSPCRPTSTLPASTSSCPRTSGRRRRGGMAGRRR
jgi:hypothetical protein